MRTKLLLIALFIFILAGCSSVKSGEANVTNKNLATDIRTVETATTSTKIEKDGTKTITLTEKNVKSTITIDSQIDTKVIPPNNSDKPTTVLAKPDGSTKVEIAPAKLPEGPSPAEKSLGFLVIVGGAVSLIGAGLVAFGLLSIRGAMIVSGAGVAMMIVASAISASASTIGLTICAGIVVAIVIGIVTWFEWNKDKKALGQTHDALEVVKKDDPQTWNKVKTQLAICQDSDVKETIKKQKFRNVRK